MQPAIYSNLPARLLVFATALLAACTSKTETDWKAAKDASTISAYAGFLTQHPGGRRADEARAAIDDLEWNSAKAKNSLDDYNKYLTDHSAGRHAVEAKTSIKALTFVPMPEDIRCSFRGYYDLSTFENGEFHTDGGVEAVTCWVSGEGPEQKKDIPLASTKFTDGMLPTKDFGNFKLTSGNNVYSAALAVAILSGKVQSLREFLQKR
jgi:hypothetical protein